ncbi:kinase-like protein [Exidia glandulosa HHB12029]|uniref:Kinase-like protein n=1 Tax=Exidia glandulosa HHB12029 TaxID=1314781 RepID=A0A165ILC7_EXIGL|nr:kinase-like protein [Exidia glandulosa HHB12029]
MVAAGSNISLTGVNNHANMDVLVLDTMPGIMAKLAAVHGTGMLVALKSRVIDNVVSHERVSEEIVQWSRVAAHAHPSILPLWGIHYGEAEVTMAHPWMYNGTISQYLTKNPDADRRKLVSQVADALAFLHDTCHLMHGHVDCANVLISDMGDALLSNFRDCAPANEASLYDSQRLVEEAALSGGLAPKTSALDVYAYGWFLYHVYTDISPQQIARDRGLVGQIVRGMIPTRPTLDSVAIDRGLDDLIWNICVACWRLNPVVRPRMSVIAWNFTMIPRGAHSLSFGLGEYWSESAIERQTAILTRAATCCTSVHCPTSVYQRASGPWNQAEHTVDDTGGAVPAASLSVAGSRTATSPESSTGNHGKEKEPDSSVKQIQSPAKEDKLSGTGVAPICKEEEIDNKDWNIVLPQADSGNGGNWGQTPKHPIKAKTETGDHVLEEGVLNAEAMEVDHATRVSAPSETGGSWVFVEGPVRRSQSVVTADGTSTHGSPYPSGESIQMHESSHGAVLSPEEHMRTLHSERMDGDSAEGHANKMESTGD